MSDQDFMHSFKPPSNRANDFLLTGIAVIFAVAISPFGVRLATGRPDLALRAIVPSLTFVLFLLIFAAACLLVGRARYALFHLLVWCFPIALLAAFEAGANFLQLADVVAPLQNLSILVHNGRFRSDGLERPKDGTGLYRPFRSDTITINELGLRTASPLPKRVSEWRIAVTGGSAAWGWRVADANTIPVLLQQILHQQGHTNVTVYNFAIEGITIAQEFDVLRRFKERYSIDQVVSYTGANDATFSYMDGALIDHWPLSPTRTFELIKTAGRLKAMLIGPSASLLARMAEAIPTLSQHNRLRDGVIVANQYCHTVHIQCNFVLQPMLLARKIPRGQEIRIAKTLNRIYPRYDEVIKTVYRATWNTGLPVDDLSGLFDQSIAPFFVDAVHINEAGNRLAAQGIAEIISDGLPKLESRTNEPP